ncbi:MAG: FIST C-terminal domain-containing protein [Gammaproteobacteria bacterium]|nr:FIST C-terminal domain-containing protein [Gammaproteobacteria bacterium]
MSLKMVTVLEKGSDSKELGLLLVKKAKEKLGDLPIALAVLYVAPSYDSPAMVSAVRSKLNDVPLIGATTGGEFTNEKIAKDSAVLILLSKSDLYKFHVAISGELNEHPEQCVKNILDKIPPKDPAFPNRSAILLNDGLAGRGEDAVMAAGLLLGPEVAFAGGSAADYLQFEKTFVFCNDQVLSNAMVMCIIDSKPPVHVAVDHGHIPVSKKMTVTKAKDNIVYEIDGKKAWDVWKDNLAEEAKNSQNLDVNQLVDASEIGAFLIRYEMGLFVKEGEYKIRVPLSKGEDDSLHFACSILEGTQFAIMKSNKELQLESSKRAVNKALAEVDKSNLAGGFFFDCICRMIILDDRFSESINIFKESLGKDVPFAGFETYGEICKDKHKISGYHNTTTTIMLLARD